MLFPNPSDKIVLEPVHAPSVISVTQQAILRDTTASQVQDCLRFHALTLRSAFQPIFSFSHQRIVGHEALLRAVCADGRPRSPQSVFAACESLQELRDLDHRCSALHAAGFSKGIHDCQWLFLNVDASAFIRDSATFDPAPPLAAIARNAGLQPCQIVIELLETALPAGDEFERWTRQLKDLGFLIALDDFGAGQSNFDRVFRLQPHIVKLDRSVIARAANDRSVRRVLAQMISLLHECATLVLIEGVETETEANIALDSNADFVQGYYFGRPSPFLIDPHQANAALCNVWAHCDDRSLDRSQSHKTLISPYANTLLDAKAALESGCGMPEACAGFLSLDETDLCYLLDGNGLQVGQNVVRTGASRLVGSDQFAPLHDVTGARWSRRPYFRRAIAAPGQLQTTRPYPTMHSRRMSVTLSVGLQVRGEMFVLCGDMLWQENRNALGFSSSVLGTET